MVWTGSKEDASRAGITEILGPPGISSEYLGRFLPGVPPNDEGHFQPHTPWFKFGWDGTWVVPPGVIRCGGPDIETSHASFNDLFEWAQHTAHIKSTDD